MTINSIHTNVIQPGTSSLVEILDEYVTAVGPKSVLAITSKIVALCEGAYVSAGSTSLEALVQQEASQYLLETDSKWKFNFTITQHTLIPNSGIDESNANGVYVFWPRDPQATANQVRAYLAGKFGHQNIGVIITDSTVRPLRRGVSGIALAHSGFNALKNYVGEPDLFGRPFVASQADIAGGLAGAAVLAMGEGAEATPIAIISGLENVEFTGQDPSLQELELLRIPIEDDLFAPFLLKARWVEGGEGQKDN